MAKQISEKRTPRRKAPKAQLAVERIQEARPRDRLTAKVLAAEAAGYGPHYGAYVADHPHAFDDWEPGDPVPIKGRACTCPSCGQTFTTTQKSAVYCSEECRAREHTARRLQAKKTTTMIKCACCGAEFAPDRKKPPVLQQCLPRQSVQRPATGKA